MTPDRQKANKITQEATQVKGVSKAVVVVSDNTAYVGLDLMDGGGTSDKRVKRDVARRVKAAVPSLNTVNVTADPDLVTRLRRIADGVNNGKPISSFTRELTEIGGKITPEKR